MNQTTEQHYNSLADDCECTEDIMSARIGCMLFLGFVVFVAIAALSFITKWISK